MNDSKYEEWVKGVIPPGWAKAPQPKSRRIRDDGAFVQYQPHWGEMRWVAYDAKGKFLCAYVGPSTAMRNTDSACPLEKGGTEG